MKTRNSKFVTSINQLEISCMKHSSGLISKLEGIYYKISLYFYQVLEYNNQVHSKYGKGIDFWGCKKKIQQVK